MSHFKDRPDAGRKLAEKLVKYARRPDVVIFALPRGGVPVAFEVARKLRAPLDVFVVRKLGVPGQEELAMGAIATGGVRVLNENVVRMLNIPDRVIEAVAKKEEQEMKRREEIYRGGLPGIDVKGRTVILVDDGLATGATMRAAVAAMRRHGPAHLIIAVPAASVEACQELGNAVDDIICAITPEPFFSVGTWYEDFSQTTDEEVRQLLRMAHEDKQDKAGQS